MLRKLLTVTLLTTLLFSCTKRAPIVPATDPLTMVKELHYGVWYVPMIEFEAYTGTDMTDKRVFYYTNYKVEWRKNGTYTLNDADHGIVTNGTWDLVSPTVFVYDKGNAQLERYYYISTIDGINYVRRGPFNKDGKMYTGYLSNEYYKR